MAQFLEVLLHELSPRLQHDLLAGETTLDEIVKAFRRKGIVLSREYLVHHLGTEVESLDRLSPSDVLTDRRLDPVVLRLSDSFPLDAMAPAIQTRFRQLTGLSETVFDIAAKAKASRPSEKKTEAPRKRAYVRNK